MQALINGMSAQWQKERSESQMTLGKLIDHLSSLEPETLVHKFHEPHSYRGYYSDLAFELVDGQQFTAAEALAIVRPCMGEIFEGYKGGDFQMGRSTPIWYASYGCCGQKIMGLKADGTLQLKEDE